jgi:glycyl-tRNA synthetase beta chain
MATFLLEIGTEELPADFARQALPQLRALVEADLERLRLPFTAVRSSGTPRRLAITIEGLAARQQDLTSERKGPPAQQAFRDGQPTEAALGFARRCGVEAERLEVRETAKGPFVFARLLERGQASADLLPDLIPTWLWSLQGRRFMRWGAGESRFSRPVRWLVALLDAEVLPVVLPDCDPPLRSDRFSRGHRLLNEAVEIADAGVYAATLAAHDVQVERGIRAAWIREHLEQAAVEAGGALDLPEALFEELVDLVESPQLIEGAIEPRFLALPPEVLSTVMRAHQRYVPLRRPEAPADPLALEASASLLPRFLCVGNGSAEAAATIRRGNERVLRARLADAEFFLRADRAVASIDRRDALDRVTFAEGLGSLRDRSERIEWLTEVLVEALAPEAAIGQAAKRAAHLCKHDLVSQMVGEFPELQGVMGAKYLLAEGEERAVALAVLEHYLPRGAGDVLPSSAAGALVALAERLELLLSIFASGERPSGSSDPYALRRAGNGLLQILWEQGWRLDLLALLERACGHWSELLPALKIDSQALAADLQAFLRARILSLLEEQGIDPDLAQAVAGESVRMERVLVHPLGVRQRAVLLGDWRQNHNDAFQSVQEVVQRAARLAESATLKDPTMIDPNRRELIDPRLFEKNSEKELYFALRELYERGLGSDLMGSSRTREHLSRSEPLGRGESEAAAISFDVFNELRIDDLKTIIHGLFEIAQKLSRLFDGDDSVMVMCDNVSIKENRLNMLLVIKNMASLLADFTKIQNRRITA